MQKVVMIEGDFTLEVDVVLRESHRYSATVTQFPVESGATISDHVYDAPDTVTMEGLISTHIHGYNAYAVDEAIAKLRLIRDFKRPVTLVTNLISYDGMILVGLTIDRDKNNGKAKASEPAAGQAVEASDSLRFTAEFSSLLIVGAQLAQLAPLPQPKPGRTLAQAKKRADGGQQSVQKVSATEVERIESVLLQTKNMLSDVLTRVRRKP